MKDYQDMIDVLAKISITVITQFRMVAEHLAHRLQEGPHRKDHQQAELKPLLLNHNQVYSALIVKPTYLDPTSGSTTTWSTSTKSRGYINMLSVPKQQSHKREVPALFEGNKQQEQKRPTTTTFKNWAAEVQIYMSLEDHNLATIMEDIKTEKVAISDAKYIDFRLHEQGLGQKNAEEARDNELQRLLGLYATRMEPITQRNAEKRQRRQARIDGVEADEVAPESRTVPNTFKSFTDEQQASIDEYTEAFLYYNRALQYALTRVTKGEPYRFVVQCNHNNSSRFETWRRLHMTYDQGEKAQQLGTLSRIMRPTWNSLQHSPSEFVMNFQNWRDEIFNYENTVSEIASSMKMALLMQYIQGDIRSHLLLTQDLATANFDTAATEG
eukprot:4618280-Amphidinium_carterae.1